ncbi:THUMP domain-containing protein [Salibacter sp.]|uniref:THUMP domain-containing class I SAM-dependent RNA methyltransferase n=1 Tax=Salibacter sp. TaxID=2010995 RepID=UPI00287007F0|nr:THUMP domain-containing protein [Salibacter sp.]MDR9488485.1 THUMP domain-containing protein [Salibacter sp.]
MKNKLSIVVKTHQGLETVLAEEIKAFGGENIEILNRAVACEGDLETVYRCNLACNTALRVLVTISSFTIQNQDDLYEGAYEIQWQRYFDVDKTFIIDGVIFSDLMRNTQFPALKVKDAIADRFRNEFGKRPSIDKISPDVRVHLLIRQDKVDIALDSSGDPLNQRNYRTRSLRAPLNEALAAGILKLAGYDGSVDIYDPFCGTGTFLTEAALIASNTAPNVNRKDFCLKNWMNFDRELWYSVLEDLRDQEKEIEARFYGSDSDQEAVDTTREHWIKLGLEPDLLRVTRNHFEDCRPKGETGLFVANPPYGKRIDEDDAVELHKAIGDLLKQEFKGFKAAIFSGSMKGLKHFGLRPFKKVPMFNGSIECKLHLYEMYAGSKKNKS